MLEIGQALCRGARQPASRAETRLARDTKRDARKLRSRATRLPVHARCSPFSPGVSSFFGAVRFPLCSLRGFVATVVSHAQRIPSN